jgi:SAM-dependent methyltransferase
LRRDEHHVATENYCYHSHCDDDEAETEIFCRAGGVARMIGQRGRDELQDAPFYIIMEEGRDDATFRASSKRDTGEIFNAVAPHLCGHQRALEIGCGIGRLLEPMGEHFRELYGADVSGEMVRRGRERMAHLPNLRLEEVDGSGALPFDDNLFDFCYSYITFHHMPEKAGVIRYIREVRRVLVPGGIFRFHLFGRPEGTWQTVRETFTKKSAWRGCKFTHREILAEAAAAGLEVVESSYIEPEIERPQHFWEKTIPHHIWITARKPTAR